MQYPTNGRTSKSSECIPIIPNHSFYGSLPYQAIPSTCQQLNNNGYTPLADKVKLEITHGKPTKGKKKSPCNRPIRQENGRKPGIMKHQCPVCFKIFSRQYNLNSHLKIHTKERPYICKYGDCTWTFARPHDLRRHELLHSGIKPFNCICGKRFSRSDAYKRHLKTNVECSIMTACMSLPATSYW
jgi:uncharacterized Zn-finger protein